MPNWNKFLQILQHMHPCSGPHFSTIISSNSTRQSSTQVFFTHLRPCMVFVSTPQWKHTHTHTTLINFCKTEAMLGKIKDKAMDLAWTAKKTGADDPRRIFHAVKVGLALTLMSLFYYFRPLYHGFGEAGMWAILTVVVVFEFSVGKC